MPFPRRVGETRRGGDYDGRHQRARKAAAEHHDASDPCARCGHALGPMGPWLHYDHDQARTGYLGFSHGSRPCPVCGKRCNIRAGAIEGNRRSRGSRIARSDPKVPTGW